MDKKATVCGLLFITLSLIANLALAVTPEDGWWWNPNETGRGFNIEIQNGTVFVATFIYDGAGQPVWFSGSGNISGSGTLNATLMRSENGQCVGCPHQAPNTTPQADISIQFHSSSNATVDWQGTTINIQRFNFALGEGVHKLLGGWSIVLTPPAGMVGLSDTIAYLEERDEAAVGIRMSDPNAPVAAVTSEESELYLSLSMISEEEMLAFLFEFQGLNRVRGITALTSADASPDEIENALRNESVSTMGFRAFSLAELEAEVATAASTRQMPESISRPDASSMVQDLKELSSLIDVEEFNLR